MLAVLSGVEFRIEECEIKRPFLISLEADIPPASAVILDVECRDHLGKLWGEQWRNPYQQITPTPKIEKVRFGLQLTKGNLGVPFIYSLIIEGDGERRIYDAEALFAAATKDMAQRTIFSLMTQELFDEIDHFAPSLNQSGTTGRSYLTFTPFHGALVRKSETERPLMVEVDGGGFSDSLLRVEVGGQTISGEEWSQTIEVPGAEYYAPTREELTVDSIGPLSFGVEMRPSSSGHHATSLSGIAFEGDKRRFYIPAADIVEERTLPESMRLLRFSNSRASALTLEFHRDKFSDFLSALPKLMEMFRNGELTPDCFPQENEFVEDDL